PTRRRTSMDFSRTSKPASFAEPLVGAMKHVRMRIVVDLPAPLGPRNPTICPFATVNERSSTATTPGYVLVRLLTSIMEQYQRRTRRGEIELNLTGEGNIPVLRRSVKSVREGTVPSTEYPVHQQKALRQI